MTSSETPKGSGRKLFYGLFIFPLLIVVGMLVLLCTVLFLTHEAETPESLITSIKTGSPSKRWQKAFELSNELNRPRSLLRESGVMKEVIHILNDRENYDGKTRAFMAMAVSRFEEAEAGRALEETLRSETEPEVQLHLLWALGARKQVEARPLVESFLQNERQDLKITAAYVLGILGDRQSAVLIEPLLSDEARDVRWNAALSLARLESPAGYEELLKMLDRKTLAAYGDLSNSEVEQIMVNAAKGVALLEKPETEPVLARLADEDPSLKVREAALQALNVVRNS